MLCRYILRPPLANERLHLAEDGTVTVEFNRPWFDGTRHIALAPQALLSRMAALVPPPRRNVTVYAGVLSSHSKWRRWMVPGPLGPAGPEAEAPADPGREEPGPDTSQEKKPKAASKYIPWHELLQRTFGDEIVCPQCGGALRLIALVKAERAIQTILTAMHLPTGPP